MHQWPLLMVQALEACLMLHFTTFGRISIAHITFVFVFFFLHFYSFLYFTKVSMILAVYSLLKFVLHEDIKTVALVLV